MPDFIGAIDQGTTSTRFFVFDRRAKIVAGHQIEHRQIYPLSGWVEHDPIEILNRTNETIRQALAMAGLTGRDLAAVGVTNQRETTVVWDRKNGLPVANAIVWQDTRTDKICKELADHGGPDRFRRKTGLPLATYFSGPKLKWLLDNTPGLRQSADKGEVLFGTIDSWLTWWLTGGPKGGVHTTDVTNASRTMMMNLDTLAWDDEILGVLGVPRTMLPVIRPSSTVVGRADSEGVFGAGVLLAGILGDQQAALFGQACFEPGDVKNTYGTGCFLLINIGERPVPSRHGLITTAAYQLEGRPAVYALEGPIAISGALVKWYRNNFGVIADSADIEELASSVPDNGGIYFVPAFSGLYAPYWRSDSRGLVIGLTHNSNKGHLARAILEATAYQTRDIYEVMRQEAGLHLADLKVDGGMVVNNLLMQFQADILGTAVLRPSIIETTALGAAYAAGLAVGFWSDLDALKANWHEEHVWRPNMPDGERQRLYGQWRKAVEKSFGWLD